MDYDPAKSRLIEANFDGLVGPTHHYGGLGVGNEASKAHRHATSYPRQAALQGLAKMGRLMELGIPQAVLPPCRRPHWTWLHQQGFDGDPADILKRVADTSPELSSAAFSSAFMWTANAATVSPVTSTSDGCLHLTIANLATNLHRAMEAHERLEQLTHLFAKVGKAIVHAPLPSSWPFRDEGAANHLRLFHPITNLGMEIFVDGGEVTETAKSSRRYLPRHSRLASKSLARLHQLKPQQIAFLQQHPTAIDAGVFHNDVISTAHENLWLYHEDAFWDAEEEIARISEQFLQHAGIPLMVVKVPRLRLSLSQAVSSYLFNSQLVTPENRRGSLNKRMHLLCPLQCREDSQVRLLIEEWIADPSNPIEHVEYVPLDQSMANGGGPACLRLRVAMRPDQLQQVASGIWLTPERRQQLEEWIVKWYPEHLKLEDLRRLDLAEHALQALDQYPTNFRPPVA